MQVTIVHNILFLNKPLKDFFCNQLTFLSPFMIIFLNYLLINESLPRWLINIRNVWSPFKKLITSFDISSASLKAIQ
jgi:hypothetical protein